MDTIAIVSVVLSVFTFIISGVVTFLFFAIRTLRTEGYRKSDNLEKQIKEAKDDSRDRRKELKTDIIKELDETKADFEKRLSKCELRLDSLYKLYGETKDMLNINTVTPDQCSDKHVDYEGRFCKKIDSLKEEIAKTQQDIASCKKSLANFDLLKAQFDQFMKAEEQKGENHKNYKKELAELKGTSMQHTVILNSIANKFDSLIKLKG
jgi:predicted Holliday junction resolvase-like endonuclease